MKRFSRIQIFLHWLTLLLLIVVYAAIEIKHLTPKHSMAREYVLTIHFTFGVLVWILMLLRIALRPVFTTPAIEPESPHAQRVIAKIVHILLYLLFLSLPLLGVAIKALNGQSWIFFGIPITPWLTPDRVLAHTVKEVHETLANLGYGLIALHALAALFHHYIQRDNTLLRMLPEKCDRQR